MIPNNRKILIADDLSSIHDDFRKILQPRPNTLPPIPGLSSFAPHLVEVPTQTVYYDLEYAFQGEETVRKVAEALEKKQPFAAVFLDVRMPPGIDGVETAERLIKVDPALQIVLCTAYSDYSFGEISRRFRESPNFLILKKPFDPAEILQVAHTLCQKWTLADSNARLVAGLEDRVRERTQELEAAKLELQQALVKAQAGERSKATFLSCLSHELYTPLNGILMSSELLAMSEDEETADYGNIIRQSSNRLQRLFSRILTFIELENGQRQPEKDAVQLETILRKCEAEQRPVAEKKGLSFTLHEIPPSLSTVTGDESKLTLLIDGVIENAIKFTESGSVEIRVVEFGHAGCGIVVEDTGPGLDEEHRAQFARLFEPGDLKFSRAKEGLGLGLCLGARIAGYFGGHLDYEPRPEGGSRFTICLPLAQTLVGAVG